MDKDEKGRVVAELTARLRSAETLFVADYRGLTMPQIDALRGRLIEHGAKFTVVKNTLTRRAAEAAGVDALLALLEGPSAIAFIESDGDMVAVAKALADSARDTKVLAIRGGLLQGRTIAASDIEELAKLPPFDVLRSQVLAAIIAPLSNLLGLVNAPLQNLVGLIDARIEQLGGEDASVPDEAAPAAEAEAPLAEVADEPVAEETATAAAVEPEAVAEPVADPAPEAAAAEAAADEPGGEPPAAAAVDAVDAEAESEPAADAAVEAAEAEAESEPAGDAAVEDEATGETDRETEEPEAAADAAPADAPTGETDTEDQEA